MPFLSERKLFRHFCKKKGGTRRATAWRMPLLDLKLNGAVGGKDLFLAVDLYVKVRNDWQNNDAMLGSTGLGKDIDE